MFALPLNALRTVAIFSFAVVFACVSGIAKADQFSSRYGQSTCTETTDNGTGEHVEFYGELNEHDDTATIGFRYVIEFQKPSHRSSRCSTVSRLAEERMRLDLERQKLELEIMKERHKVEPKTGDRIDHDW